VPNDKLAHIAEPGRRLDETSQGSGLGLAIASDLAEAYGLGLAFGKSSLGGLAVTVSFPAAPATRTPAEPPVVAFHRQPDYKPAGS